MVQGGDSGTLVVTFVFDHPLLSPQPTKLTAGTLLWGDPQRPSGTSSLHSALNMMSVVNLTRMPPKAGFPWKNMCSRPSFARLALCSSKPTVHHNHPCIPCGKDLEIFRGRSRLQSRRCGVSSSFGIGLSPVRPCASLGYAFAQCGQVAPFLGPKEKELPC